MQDVISGTSRLSKLQDLCLADPLWGDSPVANLSNYQTFMLAQLPQLTSLDTLVLAQETKTAAATMFAKKQLYYNMRIRTLRRALDDLCRQAKASQQVRGLPMPGANLPSAACALYTYMTRACCSRTQRAV